MNLNVGKRIHRRSWIPLPMRKEVIKIFKNCVERMINQIWYSQTGRGVKGYLDDDDDDDNLSYGSETENSG